MLNFQRKVVRYKAVQIPKELGEVFLQFSRDNILNNTETCGVLGGKDAGTEFVVTRLIIPKQQGTSDSCTALDKQSIHDVFEKHNCIVLGWIHTHPSQTAFLSSVDLHNHFGYQCQLQEAVTIVCSIKYNNKICFHLTRHGMNVIKDCKQSGFHQHSNTITSLYEQCSHVEFRDIDFDVEDLR